VCIRDNRNGSRTALFSYRYAGAEPLTIPIGPQNRFTSGDENRGQPTTFVTTTPRDIALRIFQVSLQAGEELTWEVDGTQASTSNPLPCQSIFPEVR
jgi:hypothetical protein